MMRRLNDVHLQRGRLLERIASQRATLQRDAQPVQTALARADWVMDRARFATAYVRQNPAIAGLALTAFVVARPRRFWRWSMRAVSLWQLWRVTRSRLASMGLAPRT